MQYACNTQTPIVALLDGLLPGPSFPSFFVALHCSSPSFRSAISAFMTSRSSATLGAIVGGLEVDLGAGLGVVGLTTVAVLSGGGVMISGSEVGLVVGLVVGSAVPSKTGQHPTCE